MTVQPIVEGHGELSAVPELLRRLEVGKPIRAHRSYLVQKTSLERYISLARMREANAVLILLDGDDDCPLELAPTLQAWAKAAASPLAFEVVFATREYEAWFLGAIESLRGHRGMAHDSRSEEKPEDHRDAKRALQDKMVAGRFYVETSDQVALTAAFDMRSAYQSCRSFRHMVKAFGALATACQTAISSWPPEGW